MKADERHLKESRLIENGREKIDNARARLHEGDRVAARESV